MAKLISEIEPFIRAHHDILVGLFCAIVGAIVGVLGAVGIQLWNNAREAKRIQEIVNQDQRRMGLEASQEQKRALAHYMNEAAVHCGKIATALANHEIPHYHGHVFDGLVKGFGDLFKPYLSPEDIKLEERMKWVSDSATVYDTVLWAAKDYNDLKEDAKQKIDEFVIDAQRLSGDLMATAERIRAAASLAPEVLPPP